MENDQHDNFDKCHDCSQEFPDDELKEYKFYDGDHYKLCDGCFEGNVVTCDECDEQLDITTSSLNVIKPSYGKGQMSICPSCSQKCDFCDKIYNKEKDSDDPFAGFQYAKHKYVCSRCYENGLVQMCSECNNFVDSDETAYDEESQNIFCDSCYKDRFTDCTECGEKVVKDDAFIYDDSYYCSDCYNAIDQDFEEVEGIDKVEEVNYNDIIKYLNFIEKKLPISVQEIKQIGLDSKLKQLIMFSFEKFKSKIITKDIVEEFKKTLHLDSYNINYGQWDSDLQRSVNDRGLVKNKKQIILKIVAKENKLDSLSYEAEFLYKEIVKDYKDNGHPYCENIIGWVRLDIEKNKNYILIDEIQCDIQNSLHRLLKIRESFFYYAPRTMVNYIREENPNISNEDLIQKFYDVCNELLQFTKNFANVANDAVSEFARKNNIPKIFYHTYEGGKQLKQNDPPLSMYSDIPKKNLFKETDEKPFGFSQNFFMREAARKIEKKYFGYKFLLSDIYQFYRNAISE